MRHPLLRFICLTFGLLAGVQVHAATNGLYADFVTSLGNFTCQLDYIHTPKTAANFVGLASGSKAWLNLSTGAATSAPFYNGSSIFRVTNEAFQAGSPTNDGNGGPGYTFPDETNASITYAQAGVLGMSSYPLGSTNVYSDSNGSQFFITVEANPPDLDAAYTKFGNVTTGLSVVTAIGAVPVDVNGKPTTPVIINSVTIRAVGASAMNFNAAAQSLPMVGGAAPAFVMDGTEPALRFSRALYSAYWLFNSPDLVNWSGQPIALYNAAPPAGDLNVSASVSGQARQFYRVPQIAYPGVVYTPPSLFGATLNFTFTKGDAAGSSVLLTFDNAGGGAVVFTPPPGSSPASGVISSYTWSQEAYRGVLSIFTETSGGAEFLNPLLLNEIFTSATGGTFLGLNYVPGNTNVESGTFTFTPPASGSSLIKAVPSGAVASVVSPIPSTSRISAVPVLSPAPAISLHLRLLPARSRVERLQER